MRHFDCLQGRAVLQARPGPPGRRVSQVSSGSGYSSYVCNYGKLSELCTEKGRHVTQCEAFQLLAGASGLTGQTGASGQTGLTGEFSLWLFLVMYAIMASSQSFAQGRGGM